MTERLRSVGDDEVEPVKKPSTRVIPFHNGRFISIINPTTRDTPETIAEADAEIEAVAKAAGVLRKLGAKGVAET